MAKPKKAPVDQVEQIHAPDFGKAVRIYREDIKPAQSKVGEYAQEQSTAYKALKKDCGLHPGAAKIVFRLDQMEESKRDDFLRTFQGLCKALNIFMPRDLADIAEGKGDVAENVVPIGDRAAPRLATIPYNGDDADLAGDAAAPEAAAAE